MEQTLARAASARDAAARRVRRVTAAAVVVCVGATGTLAALAAGSTHFRKAAPHRVVRPPARRRSAVHAPAPPIVPLAGADAGAAAAPPPAPAPTPSAAPPVAVSGGS